LNIETNKIIEEQIQRVKSTVKDEELSFGSRKVNSRIRELGNTLRTRRTKVGDIPFYSDDVLELFLNGKLKPSDKFGFDHSKFYELEEKFVKSGRNRDDLFHKLHNEQLFWYCEICFDEFVDKKSVIDHIKKSHDKEQLEEEFENMKENDFDGNPTIEDLIDHELAYFCKVCNKRFKDSRQAYNALSHYKQLHSINDMKKVLNFEGGF